MSFCVHVCPPPLPRSLDHKVLFEYLGPLGTFWIPYTFRYILDTVDLKVPFGYLGSLGTLLIPWTFMYLLGTLDIEVHFG